VIVTAAPVTVTCEVVTSMLSKVELSLLRLMRMLPVPFLMFSLKVIVGVDVEPV
jgi:hypothetical protein